MKWVTMLLFSSASIRGFAKVVAVGLIGGCLSQSIPAAQTEEIRRVLVLNDLGTIASPGFAEIDQAIWAGLQKSPHRIELYQESLELTLFSDEVSQHRFREEFVRKYSDRKPDLIITAGSASLKFIAESPERFVRDTPIIFCTILGQLPDRLRPDMHFTGVLGRLQPEETLNVALRLLPGTEHVVVTGGMGKFDQRWEDIAKKSFRKYESKLDFTYLMDLTMPTLLERLRSLPKNTIIYHTAITQDAAGERFIDSAEAVPLVVGAANAPVFVVDDVDLRAGTVGGDLVNWADDARVAAGMAVRVLNGERPEDIPVVTSNNAYMFDWQALKRWGVNENNLPAGSIVLNRQPSFWEAYKSYILATTFVLLTQSVVISALLWQRARRRKAEAELRKSEEKFSKAFQRSPLAFTLASLVNYQFVDVNDTFEHYTGWRRDEVIGRTPLELQFWVDTTQRSTFIDQLRAEGAVRNMEILFRRKDGAVRTGFVSSELIDVNGEPSALSLIADITERKAAEEALVSLSGRLIGAQEEERKRIAREIHDDYNQRLAILASDLEELAEDDGRPRVELGQYLHQLSNSAGELGADLHSLSHRLHSSTLRNLGLVAGVKSFCKEFEEQQGIQVSFTHDNVPGVIPEDVALCLFRIAQEALRNVKRHSAVNRAEVHLEWLDARLTLEISDRGRGFDSKNPAADRGIGIQSMEERLRALGGHFEIHSQPMQGTKIEAWVPLEIDRRGTA